jgi:hypothetical protein
MPLGGIPLESLKIRKTSEDETAYVAVAKQSSKPVTCDGDNRIIIFRITGKKVKGKGKAIPLQAWTGPEGSRRLRLPDQDNRHMKVVRLSALRTGRLYSSGNNPGTHFS